MSAARLPRIFFKFADNVVDPAPDYDSSDEERVLWGLSALDKPQELVELKLCLETMLAQLSDEELNRLWSRSGARIKYTDPSLARAILETATVVIAAELNT